MNHRLRKSEKIMRNYIIVYFIEGEAMRYMGPFVTDVDAENYLRENEKYFPFGAYVQELRPFGDFSENPYYP